MGKTYLGTNLIYVDYVGTLTITGTYASSTYYTAAECRMGCNKNGDLFITIQGGTSASYENVYFTSVSVPSGVSFVGQPNYQYTSGAVGQYYTAIFTGVTAKVNVSINLSAVNSTYDYVQADVTITLA